MNIFVVLQDGEISYKTYRPAAATGTTVKDLMESYYRGSKEYLVASE